MLKAVVRVPQMGTSKLQLGHIQMGTAPVSPSGQGPSHHPAGAGPQGQSQPWAPGNSLGARPKPVQALGLLAGPYGQGPYLARAKEAGVQPCCGVAGVGVDGCWAALVSWAWAGLRSPRVRQGEAGLAFRALLVIQTQKFIAESGHKQEHVYWNRKRDHTVPFTLLISLVNDLIPVYIFSSPSVN